MTDRDFTEKMDELIGDLCYITTDLAEACEMAEMETSFSDPPVDLSQDFINQALEIWRDHEGRIQTRHEDFLKKLNELQALCVEYTEGEPMLNKTPFEKLKDSIFELKETLSARGVRFHSVYEGLGVLQNDLLFFREDTDGLDKAYSDLINESSVRDEQPNAFGELFVLARRLQSFGEICINSLWDLIRDAQYLMNLIDHARQTREPLIFPVEKEEVW